jgi:hypothetical protein
LARVDQADMQADVAGALRHLTGTATVLFLRFRSEQLRGGARLGGIVYQQLFSVCRRPEDASLVLRCLQHQQDVSTAKHVVIGPLSLPKRLTGRVKLNGGSGR